MHTAYHDVARVFPSEPLAVHRVEGAADLPYADPQIRSKHVREALIGPFAACALVVRVACRGSPVWAFLKGVLVSPVPKT